MLKFFRLMNVKNVTNEKFQIINSERLSYVQKFPRHYLGKIDVIKIPRVRYKTLIRKV